MKTSIWGTLNSWVLWFIAPGQPALAFIALMSAITSLYAINLAWHEYRLRRPDDSLRFNAYRGMAISTSGNCVLAVIFLINWDWLRAGVNVDMFFGVTTTFGVLIFLMTQRAHMRWG